MNDPAPIRTHPSSESQLANGVKAAAFSVVVALVLASGLFGIASSGQFGGAVRVIAVGVVVAIGAAAIGAFLGLLFGLPRGIEDPAVVQGSKARFEFNNNLLKVSDWVTTIIVGLTLVNLRGIPHALSVFADWIRPGLGDRPASGAFGVGLLVVGAVCSFILMYIWTIVSLRRSLEKAARDIEGLWSDLVADVAAGRVSAEEVKTQLRANPPLLAHIKSNQDYTPPRLTRLADEVEAEPKV